MKLPLIEKISRACKFLLCNIFIAILLPNKVSAGQTGTGNILHLQNAYGGWIFSVGHQDNNPESCEKPTLKLDSSHTQYNEIFSLILSAYTTEKPVVIFTSGCDSNGYNEVSMIYTRWGD